MLQEAWLKQLLVLLTHILDMLMLPLLIQLMLLLLILL
jgi:hypothetical protein